jgi:segregation and condensation protein A
MIEVQVAGATPSDQQHRVRVGDFDGPLALLLALIESRELDVLTVPLADLVEGFLDALASVEVERVGSLSSFVAVAAQLILIKSRALLPGPRPADAGEGDEGTVADPEEELRRRLVAYRAFRDAGAWLGERWLLADGGSFHREAAIAIASARSAADAAPPVMPAEPLDPGLLADAVAGLARIAVPAASPPGSLRRTIAVEERAAVIRAALESAPLVVLQDLLRGVRDRVVAAVTFLAMLELVKQREITIEQSEPWGAIVCRRK